MGDFSRSFCCYGKLLCQKIDINILNNDWVAFWDHGYDINRYTGLVKISRQNLRLGKCFEPQLGDSSEIKVANPWMLPTKHGFENTIKMI